MEAHPREQGARNITGESASSALRQVHSLHLMARQRKEGDDPVVGIHAYMDRRCSTDVRAPS